MKNLTELKRTVVVIDHNQQVKIKGGQDENEIIIVDGEVF